MMLKLAFAGFGVVGRGLAELLHAKSKLLASRYGLECSVVAVSDKLKGAVMDPSGLDLGKLIKAGEKGKLEELKAPKKGFDVLQMIQEAGADALVEVTYTDIKTGEPATTHIRKALELGMHVVTTNKGPVALYYRELAELAKKKGVKFLFEGTVMSGTPVLNLLRENLAGCEITEMRGILNGTTNYILTKMEEGLPYADALKSAQALGYAEAIPDADVLGWDALAKVTILANVVLGARLKPFDCPCEGITKIKPEDVKAARAEGKRYKLIGRVWMEGNAVRASVGPQRVELTHPLAGVGGATNALTITTDALGEVTIIGPGAGKRETGYSLLNDLLHIGGRL
ncbi:MAG: homoserine dehydrogenase [Thermoplasmata archaeon]